MGSGPLTPAQLVPTSRLPETQFLQALSTLLPDDQACARLADAVTDPRVDAALFERLLRRELAELYRWAVRRLKATADGPRDDLAVPRRVIALLPRAGAASHVIRRAAPFAALGIETICSFPASLSSGSSVTHKLARRLGLADCLSSCDHPDRALRQTDAQSLTVVTGRQQSIKAVRAGARGRVIGAAGDCAVVISVVPESGGQLLRALRGTSPEGSCTRVAAALCPANWSDAATTLERLHPSVLFAPEADTPPSFLNGFRILPCDATGSVRETVGFGADPRFGWPGDYLV